MCTFIRNEKAMNVSGIKIFYIKIIYIFFYLHNDLPIGISMTSMESIMYVKNFHCVKRWTVLRLTYYYIELTFDVNELR